MTRPTIYIIFAQHSSSLPPRYSPSALVTCAAPKLTAMGRSEGHRSTQMSVTGKSALGMESAETGLRSTVVCVRPDGPARIVRLRLRASTDPVANRAITKASQPARLDSVNVSAQPVSGGLTVKLTSTSARCRAARSPAQELASASTKSTRTPASANLDI